jgi:hypothetical protein
MPWGGRGSWSRKVQVSMRQGRRRMISYRRLEGRHPVTLPPPAQTAEQAAEQPARKTEDCATQLPLDLEERG